MLSELQRLRNAVLLNMSPRRPWRVLVLGTSTAVLVLALYLLAQYWTSLRLASVDDLFLRNLKAAGFLKENETGAVGDSPEDAVSVSNASIRRKALQYVIAEPDLCRRHPDLEIISYVHSSPRLRGNRQLIRDTWGSLRYYPQLRMRVIFVFGAAASEVEQHRIRAESDAYRDIIQLDFVDSYKNLSYKGVGALQWISEHCLQARWILKSDDDMVINVFSLASYLRHYVLWETEASGRPPSEILCAVWKRMPVLRGAGCAKWCVSVEEFPNSTFPVYCSGSAFIIPTPLAPRLYQAYFSAWFLWVDDAYITGILAQEAGIKHKAVHSLYELNYKRIEETLVHGNRLFCHYPGKAAPRAKYWPLIVAKELSQNYSRPPERLLPAPPGGS